MLYHFKPVTVLTKCIPFCVAKIVQVHSLLKITFTTYTIHFGVAQINYCKVIFLLDLLLFIDRV